MSIAIELVLILVAERDVQASRIILTNAVDGYRAMHFRAIIVYLIS